MPIYERPVDRGARRGRFLESRMSGEFLAARRCAGLSQRELARQVGVSHNKVRRVERGVAGEINIELGARLAAVLGLELSAGLYPDGDPVRDSAHLHLLERFRDRLPERLTWRTEVPVPISGDRRSADAVIGGIPVPILIEAETRIDDVQALERKIRGKLRDLGLSRVILVVSDTRHNRHVVRTVPALRTAFPLSTRACMASLRRGQDPGADGLVLV